MFDYINKVRRGFRDQHGFKPASGTKEEPIFDNIPDGVYPMDIDGKTDNVKILNGQISCCNFEN